MAPAQAQADTLTYTGINVQNGAIDGVNLAGQTATVTIEFADGLTASGGVYHLGPISWATYEFSQAGLFSIDSPQNDLDFGSVNGFELSFFQASLNTLGMLSGTTAGDVGLDPLEGETLQALFNRLGDGADIHFTQPSNFQMLNPEIGTLNGGASSVTSRITGQIGSQVTLTLNIVPEPASMVALGLGGMGLLVRRNRR